MSRGSQQLTFKLPNYKPTGKPKENGELAWWRNWLVSIVFGLWHEKKQTLSKMGFPARPVHQKEIFREKCRRVEMLKMEGLWGCTRQYPYAMDHGHNWIERRVNEVATLKYGPTVDGVLKVVNVTAGYYAPNPKLFK
jgi:hypothetical protein